MSVILCKELFPGRKGSDGIERKLKHTRIFEVLTDDPLDDDYIAGAGDGVTIPRNGDIHPSDPFAVMVAISADQDDELPTRWIVVCEYDTEIPGAQAREAGSYDTSGQSQAGGQGSSPSSPGNPMARDDDPTTRPTAWSIATEQTQEIAKFMIPGKTPHDNDSAIAWDAADLLISNSAGDPFLPPAMKEVSYAVITAVKNYALGSSILNIDTQAEYRDHVNAGGWKGAEGGTVRCVALDVTFSIENSIPFGIVTFRFKYKPYVYDADSNIVDGGWDLRILDAGYREIIGGIPGPIYVPDGSGIKPDEPVKLNGDGLRKPEADPDVYLVFGVYPNADFDALGL